MTKRQRNAVYRAYLGLCVLQTMMRKEGLTAGLETTKELMHDMGVEFPFISERVAVSALRNERSS